MQPLPYVDRVQAYVFSGGTENNLAAVKSDFEQALELEEGNVDAQLGSADIYFIWEIMNELWSSSEKTLKKWQRFEIQGKIEELESGNTYDSSGKARN